MPHTTDTVSSSATSTALSEAGVRVLCDTPHVMSHHHVLGVLVSVCGLTRFVSSESSLSAGTIGGTWREVQKRKLVNGL